MSSPPKKVLVNPNFGKNVGSQPKRTMHVNPKFHKLDHTPSLPQSQVRVHVNPNFSGRPLPEVPKESDGRQYYINPSFLDPSKTKAYDEAVKLAIEKKKIFLNPKKMSTANVAPKAVPESSPSSSSEKENKSTTIHASHSSPAHCKKSLFRKIGTRKLIRVKSSAKKGQATPLNKKVQSPLTIRSESRTKFRKIGTKKLVRVKSVTLKTAASPSPRNHKFVPSRNKTPRSLFSTPFSLRKIRRRPPLSNTPPTFLNGQQKKYLGKRLTNIFSPFRVDRRVHQVKAISPKLSTVVEKNSADKSIAEPLKKPVPPKPARKTQHTTLINVGGVRYAVSDNCRKLNRIEPKVVAGSQQSSEVVKPAATDNSLPKKLYLDGEEYIEEEPGVLIRSRNSMTRQSITSYKNRSINTILKSQTRSKQYCMFFNKFGKCNKRDQGMCPYIHDQSKVAVCRKFLQGACHNENCLLSHQVAPEKMPSCKFFLQGLCTRDPCPYRHVHVNAEAEVCPDFLKGYCPAGDDCKKKHFTEKKVADKEDRKEKSGGVVMREKKIPPAKPKRKSLCQTPMGEKKARVRYYHDQREVQLDEEAKKSTDGSQSSLATSNSMQSPDYEEKRKRLLQKIELTKQGWTGMAAVDLSKQTSEPAVLVNSLNDSGPYEEIPDDTDDRTSRRPPLGRLPSFISLNTSADGDLPPEDNVRISNNEPETENFDERLI